MVATLKKALAEKGLLDAPRLRLVVPEAFAPERPCSLDFVWHCEQIRFLARAHELDWLVKQETRGYAGLESMPEEEVQRVYRQVGKAIQCRRDNIPFEDAGLIEFYEDP